MPDTQNPDEADLPLEALTGDVFEGLDTAACIIARLPERADGVRDYVYLAMNTAMMDMFGVPDLTGQTIRENFPDEGESWYDDYDRVLESGYPARFERASEAQQKVLEMAITRLPGPPRLLVVMQNITRRHDAKVALQKKADQQGLLNRELHHRVKNLFSMILAITSQSLRRLTEQGPVQALQNRLRAMSAANDILLQQDWQAAKIGDIALAVARETGLPERLHISGPEVLLDAQTTLNLTMMLHELGTNALKYGAFSVPDGRVNLTWSTEEAQKGRILHLHWRERGGPPAVKPTHRGFGSQLVQMGVAHGGEVDLDFAEEGLTVTVAAPIA